MKCIRNMYEALGVKDIDLILKKPEQPTPKDPALEHIDALGWKTISSISWTRPSEHTLQRI